MASPTTNTRVPTAFAQRQRSGMLDAARAGVQASFAVISYKGRAWALKHRGETQILKDARGAPFPTLEVVIVGVAPNVSKIFYIKSYTEGDDNAPDCFSLDGVAPDAASPVKQNDLCGTCRNNAWGSKITEAGKRAKACQDSRRIAVVPASDIINKSFGGPMLLRIPPTSLPNLASYSDFLDRKGADFPYVVTVLGFDYAVAYPKITFEAAGFISDAQAEQVVEVMKDPLIQRMLYEAGPTEPAAGPAAVAEPRQEQSSALDQGGPAAAFRTGLPALNRDPDDIAALIKPDDDDDDEIPKAPPPKPVERVVFKPQIVDPPAASNPFQARVPNGQGGPPVEGPPTVEGQSQAAPRGRRPRATTPTPAAAPPNLESALRDLLDEDESA